MTTPLEICETIACWLNEANPEDPGWSAETWETFRLACRVHGVAPLLYQKLQTAAWATPELRAWLAEQYEFNNQRVARMGGGIKRDSGPVCGQQSPFNAP